MHVILRADEELAIDKNYTVYTTHCNVCAKQASSKKAKPQGVTKSNTQEKASPRTPRSKSARKGAKSKKAAAVEVPERCEGILCPAAMENLYYIAHSAADALRLRGFRWRKRKGGRKKK